MGNLCLRFLQLSEIGSGANAMGFQIGFQASFGLSFLAAGFIIFLIKVSDIFPSKIFIKFERNYFNDSQSKASSL